MSLAIAARPSARPAVVARSLPRPSACYVWPSRNNVCARGRANELGELGALRTSQAVAPGTTFVDEGAPALHVFTVTEGVVKLFKLLPDGRRQIVGFLVAGDIFGFMPGDKYTVSAEAVLPVTLYRFPRRQLERAFTEFPGVEHQLLDAITRELAAAQEQMLLLGRKNARERLASFLVSLSRRQGNEDGSIDLPMTRADIADYLGLTMETVSRVFTVLKDSGCIAASGASKVQVVDADALAELADGMAGDA